MQREGGGNTSAETRGKLADGSGLWWCFLCSSDWRARADARRQEGWSPRDEAGAAGLRSYRQGDLAVEAVSCLPP